jgi:hypothetical protein
MNKDELRNKYIKQFAFMGKGFSQELLEQFMERTPMIIIDVFCNGIFYFPENLSSASPLPDNWFNSYVDVFHRSKVI